MNRESPLCTPSPRRLCDITSKATRAGWLLLLTALAAVSSGANDLSPLTTARDLYEQRHHAEAVAAFTELVNVPRHEAEARYYLGLLALRAIEYAAAIEQLEKAVEIEPAKSEYLRSLGDAYAVRAQNVNPLSGYRLARKSLRAYEAAVAADPDYTRARWSLMDYYRQVPGFLGGDTDKAYEQSAAITRIDPDGGRWARALVLLSDEKPAEALALFQDSLTAEPGDYSDLLRFGYLAQWTGQRREDGLRALDRCLTLDPPPDADGHADVHVARGRLLQMLGRTTAARDAFTTALALDPSLHTAAEALADLAP